MTVNDNHLDSILIEVGEFGRYQRRMCFFILIASMIAYFPSVVYVFETKQVNHRCEVPQCELISSEFVPSWWEIAIPAVDNHPAQCAQYRRTNNNHTCEEFDFNRNIVDSCENYVYETSEISIIQDFDLHCSENVWKLTTVGTINSAGLFVGLPIAGVLSDKFGRKTVLTGTLVLSGIAGLTRSFTHNYIFFVIMEFLEAAVGAGAYATAFVIGVELVGPGKRILVGLLINSSYAVGGIFEGGIAWALQSWRPLLQVLYGLTAICVVYYWLVPESVRWLVTEKRYKDAQTILENLAKVNKKTIKKESLEKLFSNSETVEEEVPARPFRELVGSSILLMRFINCALCWVVTVFVYNGLTINSVELSGNSYLDFILTIFVEIPGAIVSYLILDRIGRRYSFALGFFISAVACIASIFVPVDLYWFALIVYLLGKFGISINMCIVYTFTTELFPTSLRNSLLSASSMFGRIGAMVAPQMPLLEATWKPLPLMLFGISSVFGCILALVLPETMNIKLPDTVEEAENISILRKLQNKPENSKNGTV